MTKEFNVFGHSETIEKQLDRLFNRANQRLSNRDNFRSFLCFFYGSNEMSIGSDYSSCIKVCNAKIDKEIVLQLKQQI